MLPRKQFRVALATLAGIAALTAAGWATSASLSDTQTVTDPARTISLDENGKVIGSVTLPAQVHSVTVPVETVTVTTTVPATTTTPPPTTTTVPVTTTTTTTPTTTTPPPAPAPPLGDARATRFTSWPTSGLSGQEVPDIGTAAFLNGDISIVSDATWSKAFSVRVNQFSHNPWFNPADGRTSAEFQAHDSVSTGAVRWYAQSVKWLSGDQYLPANVGAGWFLFSQLDYLGITSPAIGLELRANGLGVDRNPGVYNGSSTPPALVVRKEALRPLADFRTGYVDIIVGAKLALDNSGWIEVWSRKHGESSWTLAYSAYNTPTSQADSNGAWVSGVDNKFGGYNGSFVGYNASREFKFLLRGISWHATKSDAIASLGG